MGQGGGDVILEADELDCQTDESRGCTTPHLTRYLTDLAPPTIPASADTISENNHSGSRSISPQPPSGAAASEAISAKSIFITTIHMYPDHMRKLTKHSAKTLNTHNGGRRPSCARIALTRVALDRDYGTAHET